jgi:hypothetical protein
MNEAGRGDFLLLHIKQDRAIDAFLWNDVADAQKVRTVRIQ